MWDCCDNQIELLSLDVVIKRFTKLFYMRLISTRSERLGARASLFLSCVYSRRDFEVFLRSLRVSRDSSSLDVVLFSLLTVL